MNGMLRRGIEGRWVYSLITITVCLFLFFLISTIPTIWTGMFDYETYRISGQAIVLHHDLYDINLYRQYHLNQYVYPPIAALLFAPLSIVPIEASRAAWYLISIIALELGCWFVVKVTRQFRRTTGTVYLDFIMINLIAFSFYPVWVGTKLGQISTLLFCLVMASLFTFSKRRECPAGVLLGLAISLKFIPLPIIAYALLRGHKKYAIMSTAVTLGTQVGSALLLTSSTITYWLYVFPTISNQVGLSNISVPNIIKTSVPNPFAISTSFAISLLAATLPFIIPARKIDFIHGVALVITGLSLFGPVVENHHLIWLILPIWLVLKEVWIGQRKIIGGISFIMFCLMSQPFRIARIIEQYTYFRLPPDSMQGGLILAIGTCMLYVVLLSLVFLRVSRDLSATVNEDDDGFRRTFSHA